MGSYDNQIKMINPFKGDIVCIDRLVTLKNVKW